MVGEIDACAKRSAVAAEQWRDVCLELRFSQGSGTQCRCRLCNACHHAVCPPPITERTSVNSGKKTQSSAALRKLTPEEPPVPGL